MIAAWNYVECTTWLRIVVAVALGLLGGIAAEKAANLLASNSEPPVVFRSVEALDSPITVGQSLKVRITRDKTRDDCTVDSRRYATNIDGEYYDLPDRIWPGGPAGTGWFDYVYDTTSLPPGAYTLHVNLMYVCEGGNRTFPIAQPSVNFRVVP